MTEGSSEFEGEQNPDLKFEETADGHKITYNPAFEESVPAALAMAAFNRAKVAKGGFMTGYSDYMSELTPKRAQELVEETQDDTRLFFLDYVHGKEVKVGARREEDGSVVLIDRDNKPLTNKAAQRIAEAADYHTWDVVDSSSGR